MENELIKIETKEGRQVVSARELYIGLGLDLSQWARWSKKNILENEFFKENEGWALLDIKSSENKRGNFSKDYAITLEFAKHLVMMARTQRSHEYRNYFIECEKQLKEVVKITKEDELILNVVKAKDVGTRMIALGEYGEYKENKVREQEVKPLQEEVKKLSPLAETLIKRFEKGENISLTDVTKTFGLKRGQVSVWSKINGYISKANIEVNKKGEEYFKVYRTQEGFKGICVTPKGIQLIEEYLEEVKKSPCRMK